MKIFFDTEFYENGKTIDLISIGMVREDGKTYYSETRGARVKAAKSEWLKKNVKPWLAGPEKSMKQIPYDIVKFAGEKPEFWAYYADYDWVVLCQLFGKMIDLPKGWPMFCMDINQLCVSVGDPELPIHGRMEHHALADAMWNKRCWEFLNTLPFSEVAI